MRRDSDLQLAGDNTYEVPWDRKTPFSKEDVWRLRAEAPASLIEFLSWLIRRKGKMHTLRALKRLILLPLFAI